MKAREKLQKVENSKNQVVENAPADEGGEAQAGKEDVVKEKEKKPVVKPAAADAPPPPPPKAKAQKKAKPGKKAKESKSKVSKGKTEPPLKADTKREELNKPVQEVTVTRRSTRASEKKK